MHELGHSLLWRPFQWDDTSGSALNHLHTVFSRMLWERGKLSVRQEVWECNSDVIQTCSDWPFSIMALRAVRSTRVDGCWFYLPVLLHILDASPDRNWANLTLSSLDSLNEWTVGGCQNSVLLCWEQSHCFLRGALNPQPNLDCCLWCSLVISFSWCVWMWRGDPGNNGEERRIWKHQCHSTILVEVRLLGI